MSEQPNVPAEQDLGDLDQGEPELLVGVAHDGPLDGSEMTSRRPFGVLLVDRPAGQAWLYDWRDGGFYARATEPMVLVDDPGAPDNRERAAEQGEWDVQAAPWVGGDPDLLDPDADPEDLPDDDVDGQDQAAEPGALGVEVAGPVNESSEG